MIEPIFSTPIYRSDDLYPFSQQQKAVLENIDVHSNNGGNLTTKNKQMLDLPDFDDCKKWIEKHLKEFCTELEVTKGAEIYITQSWFNINWKHTRHHSHYHPNSLISGILYTHGNSNEGKAKGTVFFNQSGQGVFGNLQCFSKGNEYTAQKIVTNFEPGRLVLFPSTLLHEVAETEIDTPRVTLSFNTFFRGEIGDVPNLTLLDIKWKTIY